MAPLCSRKEWRSRPVDEFSMISPRAQSEKSSGIIDALSDSLSQLRHRLMELTPSSPLGRRFPSCSPLGRRLLPCAPSETGLSPCSPLGERLAPCSSSGKRLSPCSPLVRRLSSHEANPADPHQEETKLLQRCARRWLARRRGQALLTLWPSIDRVRTLYLDESAVAAGAMNNPMYTDESLVHREALRSNPLVMSALSFAWDACSGKASVLSKDAYMSMARRIYLLLHFDEVDNLTPDPDECIRFSPCIPSFASSVEGMPIIHPRSHHYSPLRELEAEFIADSGWKNHLTKRDFDCSWFQLADLHTDGIGAGSYSSWIRDTVARIKHPSRPDQWRDDQTIISEAIARLQAGGDHTSFKKKKKIKKSKPKPKLPGVVLTALDSTRCSARDVKSVSTQGGSGSGSSNKDVWSRLHWEAKFLAAQKDERTRVNQDRFELRTPSRCSSLSSPNSMEKTGNSSTPERLSRRMSIGVAKQDRSEVSYLSSPNSKEMTGSDPKPKRLSRRMSIEIAKQDELVVRTHSCCSSLSSPNSKDMPGSNTAPKHLSRRMSLP